MEDLSSKPARCKVCDDPIPCGNKSCETFVRVDAEELFPRAPGEKHAEALLAGLKMSDAPEPVGFISHDEKSALKYDTGKLPLELLPYDVLIEIAKVLQFGAKKYAPNNWRGGFKYSRLFGALMRHLWTWWRGEDCDPEAGLSHLAHAGCCLFFLLHFVLEGESENDDREENNE